MAADRSNSNGRKADGSEPAIFVVDDDRDFADNVAELIAESGFGATVLTHGPEARDEFLRRPVDFAVLDLNLPDGSGLDLLTSIKHRYPDSVCIVVTGDATVENAVACLNRGAFSYIVKGADASEIRSAIQNGLNQIRIEREVRQLREHSQTVIENFPGRILVLDAVGSLLHTNDFPIIREDFFVHELPQLANDPDDPLRRRLGPTERHIVEAYAEMLRSSHRMILPELLLGDGPGESRYYTIHGIPLARETGRFLLFIFDVTEAVRLREEIKRSERLATVGELAMTIAHEIRNPLTGISGAVQVLQAKMSARSPDRQICEEVIQLIDRLNRTIEDLLLMSRPQTVDPVKTSLRDVIEPYLKLFRDDPQYRDITVETEYRTDTDSFSGDAFRLRQALDNVIINAAQAMAGNGRIHLLVERAAQFLQVRIIDEGPGFPAPPDQLLEPFFTTKPAGTGLGLTITRKIVEAHGGRLKLIARAVGAEVRIEVPALEEPR